MRSKRSSSYSSSQSTTSLFLRFCLVAVVLAVLVGWAPRDQLHQQLNDGRTAMPLPLIPAMTRQQQLQAWPLTFGVEAFEDCQPPNPTSPPWCVGSFTNPDLSFGPCSQSASTGCPCSLQCPPSGGCDGQSIICPAGVDCFVNCSAIGSPGGNCRGATIDCTQSTNCYVLCNSNDANEICQDMTVRCPDWGGGSCVLNCIEPTDDATAVCQNVELHCNNANSCFFNCHDTNCVKSDNTSLGLFCEDATTCSLSCTGMTGSGGGADGECPKYGSPSPVTPPVCPAPINPSASTSRTLSPTTSPSITPSITPTNTPSNTPSVTPSITASVTPSVTPSITPSVTPSITSSVTPTRTTSVTPSVTPTVTRTRTSTPSTSRTRTSTPNPSRTSTSTPTPSITGTPRMSTSAAVTRTPSTSLHPSPSDILGSTCENIVCVDDDPCTVEICLDGVCTHQRLACDDSVFCTIDTCVDGFCRHVPIEGCGTTSEDRDCGKINDCGTCANTGGCSFLQCVRADSELSNVTSFLINNSTQLSVLFTSNPASRLRELLDVWFELNSMSVFLVNETDFVSLGQAQGVFGACLSDDSVDEVARSYEATDVTCEVSKDCRAPEVNLLSSQVGTIATSVGAAGGGGVGCFCGACVVAVLFFRRKKKKDTDLAKAHSVAFSNTDEIKFDVNDLFTNDQNLMNPLFEHST